MEILMNLLYFCAIIIVSTAQHDAPPCSDEIPRQARGFPCIGCAPTGDLLPLYPSLQPLLRDSYINGISSHRIKRGTKPSDEDETLSFIGNEGVEDRRQTHKNTHKKHQHHSHKHRKSKVHRSVVDTPATFDLQQQENEKFEELNALQYSGSGSALLEKWEEFFDQVEQWGVNDYEDQFERAKRSTPRLSQWQKVLDLFGRPSHGQTEKDLSPSVEHSNTDDTRKLEILNEIRHQLEEEIANDKEALSRQGHRRQHPLVDIEAKKEEIEVLEEVEESLQHSSLTEEDHVMGAHPHSNERHHQHEHQHGVSRHPSEVLSHSHDRKLGEATPSLDKLEEQVLEDIKDVENKGLTRKQGIQLEKEVEGLKELEKQTTEDMLKDDDSQTNLNEIEERLQLWGVLQQLEEKLKTEFPNTKLSRREQRSVDVDKSERERVKRGSLMALLQHAMANLAAHDHHKQTKSTTDTTTKPQANWEDEEEDIGQVDRERCHRCEPLIGEEVCGANGKTYVSLCHAVNCAGLRESDIAAGRCLEEDDCANNECGDTEECVPMIHGTCLALYSKDGFNRVPCRRHVCVTKEECGNAGDHAQICGENGKTYPSLCYLHKAGVRLAYTGPCRPQLCQGEVCGSDGITYESSCHARAHGVRIDYTGECFTEDSQDGKLLNCAVVREIGRCEKLKCSDPVLPAGACCPVCGGAVIVHPDSAALAELAVSWEEINHLYVVENFLRHLLSKDEAEKCDLTAILTNSGNFSVVLSAATAADHTICLTASKNLVQTINKKTPASQDAMLQPVAMTAALINPFNPEATIKGYLLKSQEKMLSKAYDIRDQAASRANDALVEADRQVKNKQYNIDMERAMSKAQLGQTLQLPVFIACAVVCTCSTMLL